MDSQSQEDIKNNGVNDGPVCSVSFSGRPVFLPFDGKHYSEYFVPACCPITA